MRGLAVLIGFLAAGTLQAGAPWFLAKPPAWTQVQKSVELRGVNPCNTPDRGFGKYDAWNRAVSLGQVLLPKRRAVAADGRFDLMIHFHGHEPARKEWVEVMDGAVLVGIDLGVGSGGYESAFAAPEAFKNLVASAERAVAERYSRPNARVRKLGLSAWSAGYGAIERILRQPHGRRTVDTVVLLDGLHAGYSPRRDSLNELQLQPFIDFAERAARGQKLMFVSHSSIIPPGYASTTETANFLIHKLRGQPSKARARPSDPMGLELISRYSKGGFHVRGFSGNDKLDHCAHIGLYRDVLGVYVKPRWK
jgi:hypothetical protein